MTSYKRNSAAVISQLKVTEGGQVVCKGPSKIQVPVRYEDKKIAQIGVQTFIYGCFPLILTETGEYSLMNITAIIEINPLKTLKVEIDEIEYYEFIFDANTVVITTIEVVRRDYVIFNILDEFIFNGKIPWYVGYEDLAKLFDRASEFANSNVGANLEVIEFLASLVTRSKADRMRYIRTQGQTYKDFEVDKIDFVPLKSLFYSVNSTLNKLSGSYFKDGVNSALIYKTDKAEKLETILRI